MPIVEQFFTCYQDPTSTMTALLTAYPACGHSSLPGAITGTYSCTCYVAGCQLCIGLPGGAFTLTKSEQCVGMVTYSNPALPFGVTYQLCLTEHKTGNRTNQFGFIGAVSNVSGSCTNTTFLGSGRLFMPDGYLDISITGAS